MLNRQTKIAYIIEDTTGEFDARRNLNPGHNSER